MKTLTSTLVLSLMLAGPAAVAMEPEEIKEEIKEEMKNLPVTQELPPVQESNLGMTDETWLTRSAIGSGDLDLIKDIVKAARPNATEEQRVLGAQATFLLEQNVIANKKQKSEASVMSPSLTAEQKEDVSWFRGFFGGWFQQDELTAEVVTSPTPVSSSSLDVKSDEAPVLPNAENSAILETKSDEPTKSASSLQIEQPAQEVIKPSLYSYFTFWNWGGAKSTSDPIAENNLGAVVTDSSNVKVETTVNNENSNKEETSGLEDTQQ